MSDYKPYKNESQFKNLAAVWLREEYGRDVWFFPPSDRFQKGLPDFIICLRGKFIAIELKNGKTYDPQPLQMVNAVKIIGAGGHALTSRNMEEFKKEIARLAITS